MAEIAVSRRKSTPEPDGSELWQALVTEAGRTVVVDVRVAVEVVAWTAQHPESPVESVVRDRVARTLDRLGPEGAPRLTHLERQGALEITDADL